MSNAILKSFDMIEELNQKFGGVIKKKETLDIALDILSILQESAIEIGEAIEHDYCEEQASVLRLEEYVEYVFQLYQLIEQQCNDGSYDYLSISDIYFKMDIVLKKARKLFNRLLGIDVTGQIRTFHDRPKYADEVGIFSKHTMENKVGIVIQGPIKREEQFTLETVKLYSKLYPGCIIIVSTWEDEDNLEEFEAYGAYVVRNCKPLHPGYGNAAFQTISSYNGLKLGKELGCEYLCKTRTDQRFYLPDMFHYLNNMLERFPLRIESIQKKRLVAVDITTMPSKIRLYNVCDMFIYGIADDVLNYFSCPIDDRDFKQIEMISPEAFAKERFAEAWFETHYIEKLGFEVQWTAEDSDFYKNEIHIIIDANMLDLIWTKYSMNEYYGRRYNGSTANTGFMDWLAAQPIYK